MLSKAITVFVTYFVLLGPVAYLNDFVDYRKPEWRFIDGVFAPAYYVRDYGPRVVRDLLWTCIERWDPYEQAEVAFRLLRDPNRMKPVIRSGR